MKTRIYLFSILLFIPFVLSTYPALAQKLVHYELYVKDTLVSFAGKEKRAIAVNGQIPMPTLKFKQGDTAEIVVHNLLEESTSLHWHGVFLPNKEDGVPFLTQQPIKPRSTYTYRFPIIQNGTHWYHSHSGLQEQIGMYGNFILEKPQDHADFRKGVDDLPAIPIVLSEWTNLNPDNINRMLHNANDWSAIKKGATQSYFESIHAGMLGIKLANEWKRMNAMDVSDVYYDKILINGQEISKLDTINGKPIKAGDQVRLRISNGGASSYFWLRYAGGKIKVVASDGNDVQPVMVDRLLIAVSETYDIILTVPQNGLSYEFSVTTEDRTRSASYFIGGGIKQLISPLPRLKYFQGMKMMNGMTKMNGDLEDNGMKMSLNQMDMNAVMYPEITGAEIIEPMKPNRVKQGENVLIQQKETTQSNIVTLNYAMLKSTSKSALPAEAFVKNLKFTLTGNMNRYVWSMDDKTISETDKIRVKKGEVLRITLYNNSMMRHPMHLHGFDFRVINGNGDHSPLKNVLDIMPMETDTIEFLADQRGDWFFHCHILYHMMAGMGRVVSVGDYQNPNLADPVNSYKMMLRETDMPHLMIQNDFATNGNDGGAMLQNSRWSLSSEWRLGYNKMHGYEIETQLGRYIGKMQWFMPFIGFDYRYREMGIDQKEKNLFNQQNRKNTRHSLSVGFNYLLPMLVNFQAQVYPDGIVRLSLIREDIPVSKRFRAGFMLNSDIEYMADLRYIVNRNIGVRTHYDSDMGFGVGVSVGY
ncbi:multicopper oxidase domain-containing protein [Pedobacter sp. MC2016-05]|uniref:multicopper oxidase family protein n=1 Tax=Pedobacter sp. MC2016-05 TaxID=2994474 RepID=UPI002246BC04|nr:multicopper oxidase domain-containing protein [Pedobacter sp. MC2016-05]MCX2475360.1 multicopper oxidase domain-containing protein [Pedobacter sp. MC2016-05]